MGPAVMPGPELEPESLVAPLEPGYGLTQFESLDDVEPFDLPSIEDEDEQAALDHLDPCFRKKPGPKPKYKPGTRQERAGKTAAAAASNTAGSWWTRPDADFTREAQRMRDSPTRMKVPGENSIIGMGGVW
jgi:hypothetical protein